MIQETQVIVIAADRALFILHDGVICSIVKIRKVSCKTDVNTQKRLPCLINSLIKKIHCLDLVSRDIVAERMIGLFDPKIQILVTMYLYLAAVFQEGSREVPGQGGRGHEKNVIGLAQEAKEGGNPHLRAGGESLTVKKIVEPAQD
jgi:hypothetical protein